MHNLCDGKGVSLAAISAMTNSPGKRSLQGRGRCIGVLIESKQPSSGTECVREASARTSLSRRINARSLVASVVLLIERGTLCALPVDNPTNVSSVASRAVDFSSLPVRSVVVALCWLLPLSKHGVHMPYTYPEDFNHDFAVEMANLVQAAYTQFESPAGWTVPAGYTAISPAGAIGPLRTKELWKAPGALGDLVGHLIPEVTFGFIATKANAAGGLDVYIAIRGTKTPLEWLDDATAGPVPFKPYEHPWGNVTRGFLLLYQPIGLQIRDALAPLAGNIRNIYIGGHSLGGALAQLAAVDLHQSGIGVRPITYIFSSPRCGDGTFADAFADAGLELWRIFNTEDLVPTVPPAACKLDDNATLNIPRLNSFIDGILRTCQVSPSGYEHVGYPIAVTFHYDTLVGNHNLTNLRNAL